MYSRIKTFELGKISSANMTNIQQHTDPRHTCMVGVDSGVSVEDAVKAKNKTVCNSTIFFRESIINKPEVEKSFWLRGPHSA